MIRFFEGSEAEYAAVVTLYNNVWPDERQFGIEQWRENDDEWPAGMLNQRFVAEADNRIVGMGDCFEKYWKHQEGTIHIAFHVQPDYEGENVEQRLYEAMLDFIGRERPDFKIVATEAREDRVGRVQFLQERGFEPVMRSPKAVFDVTRFDETAYQRLFSQLAGEGIHIYTLGELYEREPNWKQKLHALRWALIQDVPSVEPPTPVSLAEFERMILDDPALDERGWFVAVNEAKQFVGMSNVWVNDPTYERLDTGLTGVIRGYRRRGIATALKVCTIRFGRELGARFIETANEENNRMYDLNLRLGFRPRAAWISYYLHRKNIL
ncbi:MAG TPA: GNAT family N-acetyltransferase [Anaerolineae bacterium]|nr:GNAT family N-acetyltransferase [Anaerolineae bacterium]